MTIAKFDSMKYKITAGELELSFDALRDFNGAKAAKGTVSATVNPPIFPGLGAFQASDVFFQPNDTTSHLLFAEQVVIDPVSGNEQRQAVLLLVSDDDAEIRSAFLGVGSGLYPANDHSLEVKEWDAVKKIFKANFTLRADYGSPSTLLSDGKIDLRY